MSLRLALERAAGGVGGFSLDGIEDAAPPSNSSLAASRGRVVLWPLANTVGAARTLIRALTEGVVPVVIPATWPRGKLDAVRAMYPRFGLFDSGALDLPDDAVTTDPRIALALLTSGSTGTPKVIATSLENLDHGLAAIHEAQGLGSVAGTGVLLPLAYSYALVNQVLWAVRFERRLTLTAGMAMPADALRHLREAGAEMVCLVGHQARLLQRYRFGAGDALPAVSVLNFAGAPFPASCVPALRVLFPRATMFNNYGCAEAMPRLTIARRNDEPADTSWVGPAIRTIELRIAGDEPIGPITFRGPSASLGLLGADGELLSHPEWISSGDQGRLGNGGLHVLGRHDQVVKVFGERVSLVEIEDALRAAGAEEAAAWVNSDDDTKGDVIEAVIGGAAPPSPDAIAGALASRLPRNLWPKDARYTHEWPTLDNGKADRQRLKAMFVSGTLQPVWPRPRAG